MKKFILVIAIAVLLVAMAVTCPQREAHLTAVNKEVKTAVTDEVEKLLGKSIAFYASLATNIASKLAIDSHFSVGNYGILSVGYVEWKEQRYPVSVGVLGHVFTVGHEQMEEKVEDYVRENIPFL